MLELLVYELGLPFSDLVVYAINLSKDPLPPARHKAILHLWNKMDPLISIFLLGLVFLIIGGLLITSRENDGNDTKRLKSYAHRDNKDHPPRSFLRLPAELRNKIYHLVLVFDDKLFPKPGESFQPPLLHVCRQTGEEATNIFYHENRFVINVNDW